MREGTSKALDVELFLDGAQISGSTDKVENRRRLVDVLNGEEDILDLVDAKVTYSGESRPRFYPLLSIEKWSILLAIPRETEQQIRQHQLLISMVGRVATTEIPAVVLIPPMTIEGAIHVPPGTRMVHLSPDRFGHFFPLTQARIVLADGFSQEAPVVLVNRRAVRAIGLMQPNAGRSTQT